MDIPEHIYDLIIQRLNEGISPAEETNLKQWVQESEENKKAYEDVCFLWNACSLIKLTDKSHKEKVWNKITSHSPTKKKKLFSWQNIAAAASIAVIFGVYSLINFYGKSEDAQWAEINKTANIRQSVKLVLNSGEEIILSDSTPKTLNVDGRNIFNHTGSLSYKESNKAKEPNVARYHELIIPKGESFNITLADGSIVYLNAESNIKYPTYFNDSIREVWIEGEAYFDIEHNPQKPFIVHTKGFETQVLGTEFNVRAYENENTEAVTLVSGSVKLVSDNNSKMLTPGHQFIFEQNEGFSASIIKEVDPYFFTAWREGIMYFDNIALDELLLRLSKWYTFDYEFKSEKLKHRLYTGGIRKNDELRKVLRLIEKVNDVEFTIKNDHILIIEK